MPGVFQKGTTCRGITSAFVLSITSFGVQRDQELPMGRARMPTEEKKKVIRHLIPMIPKSQPTTRKQQNVIEKHDGGLRSASRSSS